MYRVLEVNVDDTGYGGVFSLVKGVIAQKQQGECIDIAAIEKFENQSNIDDLNKYGCKVNYIGFTGNKIFKQFVCFNNLRKLIKKEKYDCVHIHADVANKLLVSGLASKTAGVKKIILHSHAAGVDGNHRKLKVFMHKGCRGLLKAIGTDYVACSDLAAHWMFPGVPEKYITIIKNGVDLDRFRYNEDSRQEVRRELGLKNEKLIGHVGRFAYQKNHEYLIDIFARLCGTRDDVRLLLVGEGELEQNIKDKVNNLGLQDKVIFYGTTDAPQKIFSAIDIFALPSNFEGLPIVGVEAQASGLPVVFSARITREAAILDNVRYIAIDDAHISEWCSSIEEFLTIQRKDTYDDMKRAGFGIQDTRNSFYKLYKKEELI